MFVMWSCSWCPGESVTSLTMVSLSSRTWSYSLREARKMSEVTFSKQWIHFRRSDFWPPTSTILMARTEDKLRSERQRNDDRPHQTLQASSGTSG